MTETIVKVPEVRLGGMVALTAVTRSGIGCAVWAVCFIPLEHCPRLRFQAIWYEPSEISSGFGTAGYFGATRPSALVRNEDSKRISVTNFKYN